MKTYGITKAKVMFTSAYPISNVNFGPKWLLENANDEYHIKYTTVDDPEEANIIIFVENQSGHDPFFIRIILGRIYRQYKDKIILYHDNDCTVTLCKTISPSIERRQFNQKSKKPLHYIARINENLRLNKVTLNEIESKERPYLFSFIGHSGTIEMRNEIFNINYKNSYISSSGYYRVWTYTNKEREKYEKVFVDSILKSKFVLCPKGNGPATYRLFETMQLGRVPVIISDQWIAVEGIDWDSFSIQIPQKDIHKIPDILEKYEHRSYDMGLKAKEIWENYFSPKVSALRLTDSAFELAQYRYGYSELFFDLIQIFYPKHFKNLLRYIKRKLIVNNKNGS